MNVKACDKNYVLYILTNNGYQHYTDKVTLKPLPINMYMNTNSMVTILAFKDVAYIPGVRITMVTATEIAFLMHWNGKLIKFTECDDSLDLFDTSAPENHRVAEDPPKFY